MEKTCNECGLLAGRLRKGRCDACYMRHYRTPEVAGGAVCASCAERRRPVLEVVRLGEDAVTLCGNCALVLSRARPRPASVAALRARLERRDLPERRGGRLPRPRATVAPRMPTFDPSVD
jgi:hypothetical protein